MQYESKGCSFTAFSTRWLIVTMLLKNSESKVRSKGELFNPENPYRRGFRYQRNRMFISYIKLPYRFVKIERERATVILLRKMPYSGTYSLRS